MIISLESAQVSAVPVHDVMSFLKMLTCLHTKDCSRNESNKRRDYTSDGNLGGDPQITRKNPHTSSIQNIGQHYKTEVFKPTHSRYGERWKL